MALQCATAASADAADTCTAVISDQWDTRVAVLAADFEWVRIELALSGSQRHSVLQLRFHARSNFDLLDGIGTVLNWLRLLENGATT